MATNYTNKLKPDPRDMACDSPLQENDIPRLVRQFGNNLAHLSKVVEDLESKLVPILGVEIPNASESCPQPTPSCPLANDLTELSYKLLNQVHKLETIITRTQL